MISYTMTITTTTTITITTTTTVLFHKVYYGHHRILFSMNAVNIQISKWFKQTIVECVNIAVLVCGKLCPVWLVLVLPE
jgi:hypothetical protein